MVSLLIPVGLLVLVLITVVALATKVKPKAVNAPETEPPVTEMFVEEQEPEELTVEDEKVVSDSTETPAIRILHIEQKVVEKVVQQFLELKWSKSKVVEDVAFALNINKSDATDIVQRIMSKNRIKWNNTQRRYLQSN
jgi:hypothetical protein